MEAGSIQIVLRLYVINISVNHGKNRKQRSNTQYIANYDKTVLIHKGRNDSTHECNSKGTKYMWHMYRPCCNIFHISQKFLPQVNLRKHACLPSRQSHGRSLGAPCLMFQTGQQSRQTRLLGGTFNYNKRMKRQKIQNQLKTGVYKWCFSNLHI